jgi:hypothetical protein
MILSLLMLTLASHTQVQDQTLPNGPVMLPPWFGAACYFVFEQFNPALGTLDEVQITSELICENYTVQMEATCQQIGTIFTTLPYKDAHLSNTWLRAGKTIWSSPQVYSASIPVPDLHVQVPFDGVLDYSGASGMTFVSPTVVPISVSASSATGTWLRQATGVGRIVLVSQASYPISPVTQTGPSCDLPIDTIVDTYIRTRLIYVYH